jgi:hypothetical protein
LLVVLTATNTNHRANKFVPFLQFSTEPFLTPFLLRHLFFSDKEKLSELAGRIEMLTQGYRPVDGGRSIWKYRANNGIDRVYESFGDSTDLRVLESKFVTGFTSGRNPATVLGKGIKNQFGGYWRQMSPDWVDEIGLRLMQTGNSRKANAGRLLLLHGYQRYINVANELGQSFFMRL